eukprot:symbB.v1.2.015560.t1/scaffold1166.1/size134334/11
MAFGVPRQAMPPRVIMPMKAGAATMRVSEAMRGISLQYDHKDLSDATLNWSKSRQLGSGSYGAVFKGEMKDGTQVAIKMIDLGALKSSGQTEDMAGFDQEVATLSKFRHPNLVTLIGWGKHYELPHRYLVYELMTGGDIYDRLLKSRKRQNPVAFHWYERLSALLDAASGLSHMHNSKPEAFHRDIKSANILLDRHGTAKMADFGLSITSKAGDAKSCKVDTISGTPGYACPIYARTGQVTEFSEVYSFGMVILEVLTAIPPAMADNTKPAMWSIIALLLLPAAALPEFPASWGAPPEIMTMDYVPLAGGYGHGSSSLSQWIYGKMQDDLKKGKPQFPPGFGEVPKAQTRDLRQLPFGYGSGSGTLAKWLEKKAQEVYQESAEEFDGATRVLQKQVFREDEFLE